MTEAVKLQIKTHGRYGKPHIFGLAGEIRHQLEITRQSQAMIITGESGAGKTEAAKRALYYLMMESSSHKHLQ